KGRPVGLTRPSSPRRGSLASGARRSAQQLKPRATRPDMKRKRAMAIVAAASADRRPNNPMTGERKMRSNRQILMLAATLVAIALPAFGASLEARKMQAQQEADLTDKVALTNQRCGSHVTAAIDWSTFNEAEVLKTAVTPYCAAALDAIEDICGDDLGKQT